MSLPKSSTFYSKRVSQITTLFLFCEQEKSSLPDFENSSPDIESMLPFSLYFPILPKVLKSIKFIEESSRPMAKVLMLEQNLL